MALARISIPIAVGALGLGVGAYLMVGNAWAFQAPAGQEDPQHAPASAGIIAATEVSTASTTFVHSTMGEGEIDLSPAPRYVALRSPDT